MEPKILCLVTEGVINCLYYYQGGRDKNQNNYADILEYSEEEEKWTRVGEMSEKTSFQAVSIAEYSNFQKYCH